MNDPATLRLTGNDAGGHDSGMAQKNAPPLLNMTLRNLRAFVAVARFRSFTKAGEHLSVSQPALTSSVRQLEDAVGVKLLNRTTRRVELTVEGQELLPTAEEILKYSERAVSDIRELAERRRGSVRVASVASFARNVVGPALLKFAERYPGISVKLRVADSDIVRHLVLEKEVDFGYASIKRSDPELTSAFVMEDVVGIVCPEDHPLARLRRPISWIEAARYDFIGLANSSVLESLKQDDPAVRDLVFPPKYEIESLEVLYSLVRAGLGVTAQPSSSFSRKEGDLVFLEVGKPVLTRQLHCLSKADRLLSTAAEGLKTMIEEQAHLPPA